MVAVAHGLLLLKALNDGGEGWEWLVGGHLHELGVLAQGVHGEVAWSGVALAGDERALHVLHEGEAGDVEHFEDDLRIKAFGLAELKSLEQTFRSNGEGQVGQEFANRCGGGGFDADELVLVGPELGNGHGELAAIVVRRAHIDAELSLPRRA